MAIWDDLQNLWQPKSVQTPTQTLKPGPTPYSSFMPGYGGKSYGPKPYSSYMPGYGPGAGAVAGATITPTGGGGAAAAPAATTPTYTPPTTEGIFGPQPAKEEVKSELSASYEPYMAELDRRLGALPGEQVDVESFVGELGASQKAGAGSAMERGLGALGVERAGEKTRSAQTLRELAADARNILEAAANIWGGSSATEAVATGIGKQTTRARGGVLATRDQAYRVIDQKMTNIKSTYEDTLREIDTWKSNQLMNVGNEFRSREDALRGMKGEAAMQEAQQWVNFVMQGLTTLDQAVKNYKLQVDSWARDRAGKLADYKAKLQAYQQHAPAEYGYNVPEVSGPQTPALAGAGGTKSPSDEELWRRMYGG